MAAAVRVRSASAAPEFSMAEFFIARPWRRRGIGAQAVRLMLDRFTGRWLITEHLRNTAAVKFWRRVVAAYTGSKYQEAHRQRRGPPALRVRRRAGDG